MKKYALLCAVMWGMFGLLYAGDEEQYFTDKIWEQVNDLSSTDAPMIISGAAEQGILIFADIINGNNFDVGLEKVKSFFGTFVTNIIAECEINKSNYFHRTYTKKEGFGSLSLYEPFKNCYSRNCESVKARNYLAVLGEIAKKVSDQPFWIDEQPLWMMVGRASYFIHYFLLWRLTEKNNELLRLETIFNVKMVVNNFKTKFEEEGLFDVIVPFTREILISIFKDHPEYSLIDLEKLNQFFEKCGLIKKGEKKDKKISGKVASSLDPFLVATTFSTVSIAGALTGLDIISESPFSDDKKRWVKLHPRITGLGCALAGVSVVGAALYWSRK